MLLETHLLQLALPRPCHHHTRPHHNPPLNLPSELQVIISNSKRNMLKTLFVTSENMQFQCKTWLCLVNCKWLAWWAWGSHNGRNDAGKCFCALHDSQSIPNRLLRYPSSELHILCSIKAMSSQLYALDLYVVRAAGSHKTRLVLKWFRLVTSPTPCFALLRPATLRLSHTMGLHYPNVVISTKSCLTDPATVLASVIGSQGHSTSRACTCALSASFMFSIFDQTEQHQALQCRFPWRQTAKRASYFLINKYVALNGLNWNRILMVHLLLMER